MVVSGQAKKMSTYIKDGHSILLDGGHGTGKTYLVNELKEYMKKTHHFIDVCEYIDVMTSQIENELTRVVRQSRPNTIFVIDPLDNAPKSTWEEIGNALNYGQFILVAQDTWKATQSVKKNTQAMSLKPRSTTVAKRLGVNSTEVTNDQRASELALETHTKPVGTKDIFTRIRDVFDSIDVDVTNEELPWIYDNLSSFYYGKNLLMSLKAIELYQRGVKEALDVMPTHNKSWGGVKYPSTFRARSAAWRTKRNEARE